MITTAGTRELFVAGQRLGSRHLIQGGFELVAVAPCSPASELLVLTAARRQFGKDPRFGQLRPEFLAHRLAALLLNLAVELRV